LRANLKNSKKKPISATLRSFLHQIGAYKNK
jgi:hypothetical protein